ncbi:hypothetical protein [Myxococcus sp. Y35]|uniref:hypothetical protein n=1 Tax=Pseudomyxococcus flavus TaxID=3115648 RepID=UPI003CEE6885
MSFDTLSIYLLPIGAILALALFAFAFWKEHQRRNRAWRTFAARRDWGCTSSLASWEIGGLYQGRQVRMNAEQRRDGGKAREYTVVQLELGRALPPDLSIRPERLGDRLLKRVGRRDEEIGDAELDDALALQNLSDEARDVLRAPAVRRQLLVLHQRFARFSIEDERLQLEAHGIPNSVEALESLVAPALLLSDALHDAVEKTRARGHA